MPPAEKLLLTGNAISPPCLQSRQAQVSLAAEIDQISLD